MSKVFRMRAWQWWAFLGAMRNVGRGDTSDAAIRRVVETARAWIALLESMESGEPAIQEMREEAAAYLARYEGEVAV